MGSSSKSLCSWEREKIARSFKKLRSIVVDPQYVCRKCARVANDEDWLCKPKSLHPRKKDKDPTQ